MVPPLADSLPEDLFECSICKDTLFDPVTLACCSKSFCRGCLQACLLRAARASGVARCPGGCNAKLPFRLPPRSDTLQRCLEAVVPEELRRREAEAAELEGGDEEPIPGRFQVWEDVAASQDLMIGDTVTVAFGTPGVVLGAAGPERVEVIFDERMDFQLLPLRVQPLEIVPQLPCHFGVLIAQRVVAAQDLMNDTTLLVRLGVKGTVLSQFSEDRVTVQFDERADGRDIPVNALYTEVQPWRKLLGGYDVGQRVAASQDLFCGAVLLVRDGVAGTVLGEYSDTRLTVQFDTRADGSEAAVNLTLGELVPLPTGQ